MDGPYRIEKWDRIIVDGVEYDETIDPVNRVVRIRRGLGREDTIRAGMAFGIVTASHPQSVPLVDVNADGDESF